MSHRAQGARLSRTCARSMSQSESNLNVVRKLCTRRWKLSSCKRREEQLSDLARQRCDQRWPVQHGTPGVLQPWRICICFSSAWTVFPTPFPVFGVCSFSRPQLFSLLVLPLCPIYLVFCGFLLQNFFQFEIMGFNIC